MKIQYVPKRFREAALAVIEHANDIIATYRAAGYTLTLRQLYYQFVSRDLLANTVQNYKMLGSVVCDARLAGMIDWDAIEDRTRNVRSLASWDSPAQIVQSCAYQYRNDPWVRQRRRVEVWIEKEALAGVFERVCNAWQVPFFCCRGYTSISEVHEAALRFKRHQEQYTLGSLPSPRQKAQKVTILHFGDHDPSGIDMSRDIVDRLGVFGVAVDFRRLALNWDQIEQHQPPPNPAKETDSRFADYQEKFGDKSYELDALTPQVLAALAEKEIKSLIDEVAWAESKRQQDEGRAALRAVGENWADVLRHLGAVKHGLPKAEIDEEAKPATEDYETSGIHGSDLYAAYYTVDPVDSKRFGDLRRDTQRAWVAVAEHVSDADDLSPEALYAVYADYLFLDTAYLALEIEQQEAWEAVSALAHRAYR